MKTKGFIHIYYGNGRGKTSILNGSAIRGISRNLKIEYLSFLKNIKGGEFDIYKTILKDKINFHSFYHFSSKFIWEMNDAEREVLKKESLEGMAYFKKVIQSKDVDLVLADEIMDMITNKFISVDDFCEVLQSKNENVEIMMSGHCLPEKVKNIVDLVSEIKLVKHYFNDGLKARKGIEF